MHHSGFTGYVDVAQVTLYAFWIFFFGLILYLHREDKREGYPLVSEVKGHTQQFATHGFIKTPEPKVFRFFHGGKSLSPATQPPRFPIGAAPVSDFPGAPIEPTGNPLVDGIGPASWCYRIDEPELTIDGKLKMTPMRDMREYSVARYSADPRGWRVIGADGMLVGVVGDLWIDEIEETMRYLEVELDEAVEPEALLRRVLLPQPYARFNKRTREVRVQSMLAWQFRDVPRLRNSEQVTFQEEEKLVAYFGGGQMYAASLRQGAPL